MRREASGLLILILTVVCLTSFVLGQSQPGLENGFKAYGSYDGGNLDSVNVMNGNWMLHAPLIPDYPQRGKLTLHDLIYMTSKSWQVVCVPNTATGQSCHWSSTAKGVVFERSLDASLQRTVVANNDGSGNIAWSSGAYTLTTGDSATHQLVAISGTVDSNGDPTQFESIDTTGYHVVLTNPDANGINNSVTVTDRQGIQYTGNYDVYTHCDPPNISPIPAVGGRAPYQIAAYFGDHACSQTAHLSHLTDSNGNQTSFFGPQNLNPGANTLGNGQPLKNFGTLSSDSSGCSTTLPFFGSSTGSYTGPNGAQLPMKACFGVLLIETAFNAGGAADVQSQPGSTANTPITTIILADGSKWTFNYDSYGNVTYVGLPTGGSMSYNWATTAIPPNCSGSAVTPVSRAVVSRTLNDNNGHSFTWNYSWGTAVNATLTNVVTDPLGNDTVHVFTDLQNSNTCSLYETSTQSYQGSQTGGQLLKRVDTVFSGAFISGSAGGGVGNVVPISIQTTVYPSGKVSLVTKQYDSGLGAGLPIFGNVVTEKEYDWDQSVPGALMRETDTTYQWQVNSAYLTADLLDLPASVIVKDGSGNRVAETDYIYDESAYLTSANISTQHVGSPYGVRGNLTTVSKWLNTGNPVVSHTNWYDTGEVYQQIDPLGHTTTHSYDSAYVGAYSTKTCDPLNHCVSGTYDLSTGLLTSLTNQNATQQAIGNTPGDAAHTSFYQYADPMWRMTSATFPPDPNNGNAQAQTGFSYSAGGVFPVTFTRTKSITASLNDSVISTYDGLGRVVTVQHPVPGGIATVNTVYDALGRAASVTNPYFSTSDPTYGLVQTQYDALGRATQVTEQDGSVKTVAYNITPVQAIAGDCTQTTDEAGKQRRACSDALGGLIEVDEPGDSYAGSLATGSLGIGGTLQSLSGVGATNAAAGSGSVTITGAEQSIFSPGDRYCAMYNENGDCVDWESSPGTTTYDSGTVVITVNGHQDSVTYGSTSTASSIASALASAINADGNAFVNASVSGAVLSLTARQTGASTNYSWSISSSTSDSADFGTVSFTGSPVSGALTGGANGSGGVTVYDAGTVTVTIGSFTASAPYGQSGNSTASAVAVALAGSGVTGLSRAGSPVTAAASGGSITITYNAVGLAGNVAVTCSSSTSQGTYFSSPSFTCPGVTLSGGTNPEGTSLDYNYLVTKYRYDALGNLLQVTQKGDPSVTSSSQWRVRNFTYDSFSRLLTAQNPESGTITYSYDAAGELLQKTSPAPNQTGSATQTISYCYDPVGRVTGRAYSAQTCQNGQLPSGTAVVTYVYDNAPNAIGKLVSLTDQAGSASYNYDVLGRIASEQRSINGVSKGLSYAYNLDGSLKSLTYPSGAIVSYAVDSAGRDLSVIDSGNAINYVTAATYGPDSALTGFVSGSSGSFAGITSSFSYNKRLQPVNMSAASPTATVFNVGYDFHFANGDNGNVYGITNNKDATRNQTFTYDPLNRLTSAQNAGIDCTQTVLQSKTKYWGNSYAYDAWGNLLSKAVTKCGAENLSVTALANNQLAGYGYDAAGNMTLDPTDGVTSTYDQENRIAAATKNGVTTTYTYDGDGNRVKKVAPPGGTLYWKMKPGIVAESDLEGNLQSEYIFFDADRIARRDFPGGAIAYYFSDDLKTASVITDSSGNIRSESDYYPWGGELQFLNNDSNHYKFTGKERDTESGLDYFGARYYSNGLGRFISADWSAPPVPVPYADLNDPQSLNQYTYVRNIPTSKADVDGHVGCSVATPQCTALSQLFERTKQLANDIGKEVANGLINTAKELSGADLVDPSGQIIPRFPTLPTDDSGSKEVAKAVVEIAPALLLPEESEAVAETSIGRYVYRGLAPGEDVSAGLTARLPDAGNSPISHVAGQLASEWISTTKSESIALQKYGQNGVVKIDLTKVSNPIVDVSNGFAGKPGMISNWAIKDQEVLIKNHVPAEAVQRIK